METFSLNVRHSKCVLCSGIFFASNESKSVLARDLDECRDNEENSQSVFFSFPKY